MKTPQVKPDWPINIRVQMHPAMDCWMQGDRFGVIVGYGRKRAYVEVATGETAMVKPARVKLDISGRIVLAHVDDLIIYDREGLA